MLGEIQVIPEDYGILDDEFAGGGNLLIFQRGVLEHLIVVEVNRLRELVGQFDPIKLRTHIPNQMRLRVSLQLPQCNQDRLARPACAPLASPLQDRKQRLPPRA